MYDDLKIKVSIYSLIYIAGININFISVIRNSDKQRDPTERRTEELG